MDKFYPDLFRELYSYLDRKTLLAVLSLNRATRQDMYIFYDRFCIWENKHFPVNNATPDFAAFMTKVRRIYTDKIWHLELASNLVAAYLRLHYIDICGERGYCDTETPKMYHLNCSFLSRSVRTLAIETLCECNIWQRMNNYRDISCLNITGLPENLETLIICDARIHNIQYPPKLKNLYMLTDANHQEEEKLPATLQEYIGCFDLQAPNISGVPSVMLFQSLGFQYNPYIEIHELGIPDDHIYIGAVNVHKLFDNLIESDIGLMREFGF